MEYSSLEQGTEESWSEGVAEARRVYDIHGRTFEYALRIIRLYRYLMKNQDFVAVVIGKQLLRSGTGIGAHLEEAHHGESRADFIHKMSIAQKEMRESKYWLRLLVASETLDTERVQPLIDETEQLLAIITSIIVSAKKNSR
jgi:four helix bundle protein